MSSTAWEATWEVAFPASSPEHRLLGLVVRDLLHGSSFDLEIGDGELAVDYFAGDEEDDGSYRLLVTARVEGPRDRAALQQLTEGVLEQLVADAEALVSRCQHLGSMALAELRFVAVPEQDERWDLVVPDWLAPDGAEVPFGFRPELASTGEPWPTDSELDAHGRVVVVPHEDTVHIYAVPAPTGTESGTSIDGSLPVIS